MTTSRRAPASHAVQSAHPKAKCDSPDAPRAVTDEKSCSPDVASPRNFAVVITKCWPGFNSTGAFPGQRPRPNLRPLQIRKNRNGLVLLHRRIDAATQYSPHVPHASRAKNSAAPHPSRPQQFFDDGRAMTGRPNGADNLRVPKHHRTHFTRAFPEHSTWPPQTPPQSAPPHRCPSQTTPPESLIIPMHAQIFFVIGNGHNPYDCTLCNRNCAESVAPGDRYGSTGAPEFLRRHLRNICIKIRFQRRGGAANPASVCTSNFISGSFTSFCRSA